MKSIFRSERFFRDNAGWHIEFREGTLGPFDSKEAAETKLAILSCNKKVDIQSNDKRNG